MKEDIIKRASRGKDSRERLNRLREELHHLLLQEADRKGAFKDICFVGGTALRILYGLDRFSEDLDFSTSAEVRKPFDLGRLARSIGASIEAFGFDCKVEKLKLERNVQSCFFSFTGLLPQMDRSFHFQHKLAVRFDVDTNPPAGAVEMVSPVTGDRLYRVRHFTLPSLFAGKLHAVLYRNYTKGRDLYDFLWYMGKHVSVNLRLLGNAIEQTQGKKISLTKESLQDLLLAKFQKIDFAVAQKEVAPFLSDVLSVSMLDEKLFSDSVKNLEVCDVG